MDAPQSTEPETDISAIHATVVDYVAGWYEGDVERIGKALHPDLVKRIPLPDQPGSLREVSRERMIELTKSGGGEDPAAEFEVEVDHVYGAIATARVRSPEYLDYLHLVKTPDGWRIANILFRTHDA